MKLTSLQSQSISTKVLAAVGATFLVLSWGQYGIARSIIARSYTRLEQKQAETNAERLQQVMSQDVNELEALSKDWGWWTATYEYTQNQNASYAEEVLTKGSFLSISVDFIILLNQDNKPLFAGMLDTKREEVFDMSPAMIADITKRTARLDLNQQGEKAKSQVFSGFLLFNQKPAILAAVPILKSDSSGIPQGTLVMGRLIDKSKLAAFSETTRLPIEAFIYQSEKLPADVQMAKTQIANLHNTRYAKALSEEKIASYSLIPNLEGQPGLLLKTSMGREIYASGKASSKYYLWSTMLVGLAFCGLTMLLLRGLLLSRLESLSSQVDKIGESQDSSRVQLSGQDELSQLADTINHTLEQLNQQAQELQLAKQVAEESREAADKANHAKSAFLANMSHELRTPLNAILGFAQVLEREDALTPPQRQKLSIINRSGEHLLSLINDVLDMSKVESGRTELSLSSFDLYDLLDMLEDMLRPKAQSKGLKFIFERSEQLPRYLYSDERKLRQVLLNLLSNAIKFTSVGSVTLSAVLAESYLDSSAIADPKKTPLSRITFAVTDTGAGLQPDELDQVFQPFVQTEAGRKSQEGTGLGLPISQKFVALMGGELAVTSEAGEGSTFCFDIVAEVTDGVNSAARSPAQKVVGLAPGQPTYRILIVDDHRLNRLLLREVLAPVGFEVKEAENGEAAIALWQTWQPDLIWMDMHMPVLDGYEATRKIKAQPSGQAMPIIALTASTLEEEQSFVTAAGCDDFMRKPFEVEQIFTKMKAFLNVDYVYETTSTTVPNDPIAACFDAEAASVAILEMPLTWRKQLQQAAAQLNQTAVIALAQEIPDSLAGLRQVIEQAVGNFDFDPIESLAEQIHLPPV